MGKSTAERTAGPTGARTDAARRLFLRYAATNLLIVALPVLTAVVYYRISIRAVQHAVDSVTTSQLERSVTEIDRLLGDIRSMSIQLSNDYEIGYYLNNRGAFTGIELYNLKRISAKLSSYVMSNGILSHCMLYLSRSDYIVNESGFSAYEGFYGPLFSCQGYTAKQWREEILHTTGGEDFYLGVSVSIGGQQARSHLYRRSIGYGGYYQGSIVAVVDEQALSRMLAELPRRYGGRVQIEDSAGRIIASTDAAAGTPEGPLVRDGETLRRYQMRSAAADWTYTAILSETKVLSAVRAVRNIALVLLALGLTIGMAAAYLFAFTNTRPLTKLFDLVLRDDRNPRGRRVSVYAQLEQAILVMSNSRQELEREIRSTEKMTRTYFFQNLLRGSYGTRAAFAEERALFRIEVAETPYYVVVARVAALNAAGETGSYAALRDALISAASRGLGPRDYVVPVSFDDIAVVRHRETARPFREDAASFVEGMRSGLDPAVRGDFSFGIGGPQDDHFLLAISYNEASTAVASVTRAGSEAIGFYEDLPKLRSWYSYPLDIEEGIIKSVRSGNVDLLESLLATLRIENFVSRHLSSGDTRNLLVEVQGTVLRVLHELPDEAPAIRAELAAWSEKPAAPESLDGLAGLLRRLAEAFNRRKRSHNSSLLESLRSYVAANYARYDLGLTAMADTFGMSENYLSNFFKEQTGECLSVAIQRTRFKEAKRLLLRTSSPVDAVAARCGYANVSSFRRAFKRWNGQSPSEYRTRGGDRE